MSPSCTPAPIPSDAIEAGAKRFERVPGKPTVALVRKRWSDTQNMVKVSSDGLKAVDAVPESFARRRLPAGSHCFTATGSEGPADLDIAGPPGSDQGRPG